jgi:hypothetical protein
MEYLEGAPKIMARYLKKVRKSYLKWDDLNNTEELCI